MGSLRNEAINIVIIIVVIMIMVKLLSLSLLLLLLFLLLFLLIYTVTMSRYIIFIMSHLSTFAPMLYSYPGLMTLSRQEGGRPGVWHRRIVTVHTRESPYLDVRLLACCYPGSPGGNVITWACPGHITMDTLSWAEGEITRGAARSRGGGFCWWRCGAPAQRERDVGAYAGVHAPPAALHDDLHQPRRAADVGLRQVSVHQRLLHQPIQLQTPSKPMLLDSM